MIEKSKTNPLNFYGKSKLEGEKFILKSKCKYFILRLGWLYSERKGESYIPIIFWYLSIFGGIGLLTYAIFRKDPVIIVGQSFGIFIYLRNLILIYKKR